jgi:hypothetical protein
LYRRDNILVSFFTLWGAVLQSAHFYLIESLLFHRIVTPHFGQRPSVVLTRRNSAGGIWYPQLEKNLAIDAFTFSRLIFFRAGIWGFYSGAVPKPVIVILGKSDGWFLNPTLGAR